MAINFLKPKKAKSSEQQTSQKPLEFYDAAADWAYDMYQSQSVRLKWALLALFSMMLLLGLSIITTLSLLPLKQKVPYLYSFNNTTGEVTKLGELEPSQISSNWQMTRYFLTHYVVNRESYDYNNIDYPFQLTYAMTDDSILKNYTDSVSSENQNSPYRVYGQDQYITVNVISINRLNDDTADVRFERRLHDRTGTTKVSQNEAIIKWKYIDPIGTQKMLDRDPLGFKVTYYQLTQVLTLN